MSLIAAGGVAYKVDAEGNRLPGIYYSPYGGNSWSYVGYTNDATSTLEWAKQFTVAEMRNSLLARRLDPNQVPMVIINIANERHTKEWYVDEFTLMIDKINQWFAGISNHEPIVFFIIQFPHEITGNPYEEMLIGDDMRDAAIDVTTKHLNTAYISLTHKIQGYPTTAEKSGSATLSEQYHDWAVLRGWNNFEGSDISFDLLEDDRSLHIRGAVEARALGSIITERLEAAYGP